MCSEPKCIDFIRLCYIFKNLEAPAEPIEANALGFCPGGGKQGRSDGGEGWRGGYGLGFVLGSAAGVLSWGGVLSWEEVVIYFAWDVYRVLFPRASPEHLQAPEGQYMYCTTIRLVQCVYNTSNTTYLLQYVQRNGSKTLHLVQNISYNTSNVKHLLKTTSTAPLIQHIYCNKSTTICLTQYLTTSLTNTQHV